MSETIDTVSCCTCGYEWQRGRDGSHRCASVLLKQRDAALAELAALKGGREAVSDADIEAAFARAGGKWDGDKWVIEDADLHPFARSMSAQPAQASAWPEGWTLVPVEPTPVMVKAAAGAITTPDNLPPVWGWLDNE